MLAAWSGSRRVGGIAMNEGQRLGQFYLTGDHNQTTETHQGEGRMRRPRTGPAAQTKVTKYQWVKVKVTDRQHICIRQDPIVEETQKSSDRPGWPAPFVTHSQRPGETDRYTWISATRSCSLTHKLHCPFHLRHPVPCQLFISPPASLAPMPSPLGQWSIRSLRTESTQTYGGWLDILNQTINTTSAPVAVSFHSHQINQSGWTCPLNSQLVNSSVMS